MSVDVADLDAGDVGDRVQRAGRAVERDAEVARPGAGVATETAETGMNYQDETERAESDGANAQPAGTLPAPTWGSCYSIDDVATGKGRPYRKGSASK